MKFNSKEKSNLFYYSIFNFIGIFFIILFFIIGCKISTINQSARFHQQFKNPPSAYLPTVYWFWNGRIESDQIKAQLEAMKRSNTVGSVCILAWEGLAIDYLSEEWFDKVKYACQIAGELGLEIWLYDEIRWPSGHAGGKVLDANPELKARCLSQTEQRVNGNQKITFEIQSEPVAIVAAQFKNQIIDESSLMDLTAYFDGSHFSWDVPAGDWSLFIYSMQPCSFKPTFLEREYVDLLNPEVAKKFIALTHDQYYQIMPKYFGSVIKAIITDEPGCYCNLKAFLLDPESIAWTPNYLAEFQSRKNYNLKKYLPALWHDVGEKTAQIRIDFYDVLSDLLQESYFKPLHDWCEAHQIKLNIQPAHEETMKYATLMQGDYFKAMEYSHLPGCDDVYSWDRSRITPKLAASAAHSFGKQDVYCEVFGAYGWDVTLEKMKGITNWLFARGVNRLLLSSFYFASEGDWRFEIPPSLFVQNTLWPYLPHYSSYVQRLSCLLSDGRTVAPIAIFYPNKNAQAELTPLNEAAVDQLDRSFIQMSNFLLSHQWDFEYMNERAVEKATIRTAGKKVVLRKEQSDIWIDHELVIVPHAKILSESALLKLKKFYEQGGKLIVYGQLPQVTPNGKDLATIAETIWKNPAGPNSNPNGGQAFFIQNNLDSLLALIEQLLIPDLRLDSPHEHISFIHKIKDGRDIYFIANSDSSPVRIQASFLNDGHPQIWNPEDGTISDAIQFQRDENRTIVPLELARYGSALIVFNQNSKERPHVVATNMDMESLEIRGDSLFVSALPTGAGENYIALFWRGQEFEQRFSADPPDSVELMDLWQFEPADHSFPAEIRRSGSWTEEQKLAQPNGSAIAPAHPYFSGTGVYSQTFFIDKSLFKKNSKLILQLGAVKDIFELWLNGVKVGERCWPPFDFDVTDYLKPGSNQIELRITNTPANHYALQSRPYRLGENWGKILPSGLMDRVRIVCYEKSRIGFLGKR
ncbi:MAG: glycosyl hydrolase [candidate division KSB1 bacterium]|nr:glycosyl hydrolase [candidate division KSB1 bacterium]